MSYDMRKEIPSIYPSFFSVYTNKFPRFSLLKTSVFPRELLRHSPGKSHIASTLIRQACLRGYNALFTSGIEIVNYLMAARAANCLDKALKRYLRPDLVCCDEIGYLPIDKLGCDLLFQVVIQRHERGSIITTSNKPFKNWTEIFNNDAAVTSAILDRLLHHSEVVIIEGKSYRMKDRETLH
jgi:DNA replication protein DnaC